jgi:glycosyltransferase involved in cell wall biosynthesis
MKPVDVHLINPMCHLGGSELHTIDLYRLLEPHCRPKIWATRQALAALADLAPITQVDPLRLSFPRRGVFVFVGAYFRVGNWLRFARPDRTILLYNIPDEAHLQRTLRTLSLNGRRPVEMLYASEELRRMAGLPGVVEDSPIDLQHFLPRADPWSPTAGREFVVGRVSRDLEVKFAETDPAFFTALVQRGYKVRIAGGTCMRPRLPDAAVELLPMLPPAALPAFLQQLDCFVYRTSRAWPEAYGRVVAEAMACALPVIVQSNAGIAQHIHHGVNGFIADDDRDVLEIVESLRITEGLAQSVGRAARATMERRYGAAQIEKIVSYYTDGARDADMTTPPAARFDEARMNR